MTEASFPVQDPGPDGTGAVHGGISLRVLFFVEPFPVRLRPLDFAWVLSAWETLAGDLERLGGQVVLACSDALSSGRASRFRTFSPALLGFHPKLATEAAESDAQWLELMRNPDDATWRPFVRALLDEARPDAVVTWTLNAPLRAECRERGLVLVHQELGPLRRPYVPLYFADPTGLSGESSVQALWPELSGVPLTRREDSELNQFIQACYPPDPSGAGELRRKLGLDPRRRTIAVFGQVSRDSNVLAWSRIAGNEALWGAVLRAADPSRDQVIVKAHPGEPAAAIPGGTMACPAAEPAARLIEVADAVVTMNSSVGFEALLRGKPVYAFGRAPYTDAGATRDIHGGAEELASRFRTDGTGLSNREDEARRRLLHFLLFRYFVPEPVHLDAGALIDRIERWKPLVPARKPTMEHFAGPPAAQLLACRAWADREEKLGEAQQRTLAEQVRAEAEQVRAEAEHARAEAERAHTEAVRVELQASLATCEQLQLQLEAARDLNQHTQQALEAARAGAQALQDELQQIRQSVGFRLLDRARRAPGIYRAYLVGKRLLHIQ